MTRDSRLGLLAVLVLGWLLPVTGTFAAELHPGYVGSTACAECHADQHAAWTGSHHDLAMQLATAETVLGNFDDAGFKLDGVTTRFFRDGDRFMVRTQGADGGTADFVVHYVFGIDPLQQLLLELPGGRLQAFGVAWDARPEGQGGQRWYHLYPDDPPRPGDRLHWSAPDQNWNHMCAECHSTDLLKLYDAASDSYATSYAEIDVGCEACHGPAAGHVTWARQPVRDADPRLAILLDERKGVSWRPDPASGQPRRSMPHTNTKEIGTCARCHSRRGRLTESYRHGAQVGNSHRVATLTPGLYQPDGQVLDEVYVYGSFLQSRMYAAGVTCSDCHQPHTLKLRADGDALCATCHVALRYAGRQHHRHDPADEGARCVACHMPATTYMGVDPRHDHSFRIPRPDLSVELGVSNACSGCHADRDAAWAATQVADWRDGKPATPGYPRHARALAAASQGLPDARNALLEVVSDHGQSAIARASAIVALGAWLDRGVVETLAASLKDPDPLVRRATVEALAATPPMIRTQLLPARLNDPVRDVRQAAAVSLSQLPLDSLDPAVNDALSVALADYRATLHLDADRAEAQHNLGVLLANLGDLGGAEAAYLKAMAIEPGYAPASVNLSDLLRESGREEEAGELLERALSNAPEEGMLHHTRGLWLVRQQQRDVALAALQRATELEPDNARFGYVLAVGLHGAGQVDAALAGSATCWPLGCTAPARSTRPWPRSTGYWRAGPTTATASLPR